MIVRYIARGTDGFTTTQCHDLANVVIEGSSFQSFQTWIDMKINRTVRMQFSEGSSDLIEVSNDSVIVFYLPFSCPK